MRHADWKSADAAKPAHSAMCGLCLLPHLHRWISGSANEVNRKVDTGAKLEVVEIQCYWLAVLVILDDRFSAALNGFGSFVQFSLFHFLGLFLPFFLARTLL